MANSKVTNLNKDMTKVNSTLLSKATNNIRLRIKVSRHLADKIPSALLNKVASNTDNSNTNSVPTMLATHKAMQATMANKDLSNTAAMTPTPKIRPINSNSRVDKAKDSLLMLRTTNSPVNLLTQTHPTTTPTPLP